MDSALLAGDTVLSPRELMGSPAWHKDIHFQGLALAAQPHTPAWEQGDLSSPGGRGGGGAVVRVRLKGWGEDRSLGSPYTSSPWDGNFWSFWLGGSGMSPLPL